MKLPLPFAKNGLPIFSDISPRYIRLDVASSLIRISRKHAYIYHMLARSKLTHRLSTTAASNV